MERLIDCVTYCSALLVPLLAVWAITCLYVLRSGYSCHVTQVVYFAALLLIAGITIRTVIADDGCWLIHTTSLGIMIVAGVMRRPAEEGTSSLVGESVSMY